MTACVDASALLAILFDEEDALEMLEKIIKFPVRLMSPVNYWEALVRTRGLLGATGVARLERLVTKLSISVVATTAEHARIAADAASRFGKPHKARLNLGDCFAYALAVSEKAPLVFKGDDFPLTDVPR